MVKDFLRFFKKRYLFIRRHPYLKTLHLSYDSTTSFIANNCFGGRIPQDLGYKYNSPTEGLFIPYPDYITFLKNLKDYTSNNITLKSKSKYDWINKYLKTLSFHVPIGDITCDGKNVEIVFLHYNTDSEAISKWKKRCDRINFDKLVIFGSDVDGATENDAKEFIQLPYENKIFFSAHKWDIEDSEEYCFIHEMADNGKINAYEKAHIIYKYLCKFKLYNK